MKKIIIVMAMEIESQGLVEKNISNLVSDSTVRLYYTGVGMLMAAHKVTEIILNEQPDLIINIGTAGSRQFKVGQLVEVTEFYNRSEQLSSLLGGKIIQPQQTQLPAASCGSADYVDTTDLADRHQILDMEAYALALVCQKMKTPFLSIKYITDSSKQNFLSEWKLQLQSAAEVLSEFIDQHIRQISLQN